MHILGVEVQHQHSLEVERVQGLLVMPDQVLQRDPAFSELLVDAPSLLSAPQVLASPLPASCGVHLVPQPPNCPNHRKAEGWLHSNEGTGEPAMMEIDEHPPVMLVAKGHGHGAPHIVR